MQNVGVRVSFLGAAQTVTGSKYLIEFDKSKVLVDCGLFQGNKENRLRNWQDPVFDPQSIAAIVLTHAHIDHTGYLPLVVRKGYRGPIYCTPATKDLLQLLLPDSAHLQEEEARYANKHGTSKHHPAKPLYSTEDAKQTLLLLKEINRDTTNQIVPGLTVAPSCAGHILGATSLTVDVLGKRITFSGDIGRYDVPILPDPQALALGDLLICESTYGDRLHEKTDTKAELAAVINEVVQRKGPLIIPAFAIGRTQTLSYYIAQLEREGVIPVLPVYIDSPMAVDATSIYRKYKNDFDEQAQLLIEQNEPPLLTERTTFCHSVEESKKLNFLKGPRIIIAASGMINGGRVLHHIMNWIDKEQTTILFVGYQAQGTRGHTIQSGADTIKVFGRVLPIRAKVKSISGLSAHGDRDELLRWLKSCSGNPKITRIVHGEPSASEAFSKLLNETFHWEAVPAKYLETVAL